MKKIFKSLISPFGKRVKPVWIFNVLVMLLIIGLVLNA